MSAHRRRRRSDGVSEARSTFATRNHSSERGCRGAHRPLRLEPLEPRLVLDGGALVISEFVTKNTRTLDNFGAKSDWIEIHNPTLDTVSLDGWYLTDDRAAKTKWQFPDPTSGVDIPLAPGGCLVVWASGTSHKVMGQPFHTSFALSQDPGYLGLIQPDGVTVSSEFAPTYPRQVPDVSYGWTTDGSREGYFFEPSPGLPNGNDPSGSPEPILVSEIMYHPGQGEPGSIGYVQENTAEEYVELYNRGKTAVSLKDWQLDKWWFASSAVGTVTSITAEDWTATVTMPGHGFVNGDTVLIRGADPTPYNGVFTITGVTTDTFNYSLSDLPGVAATGTIQTQKASQKMPDVTIAAQGYLVIAGEGPTFHAKYPAVTNYVAAWTPRLSDSGESITLRNSLGDQVDKVTYANQGDWAQRTRGEQKVTDVSRSGTSTTVTFTVPYHNYTLNYRAEDKIYRIAGADQAEFNGEWTATAMTRDTITFTIPGTSTTATGNIVIQKKDAYHYGWEWRTGADGNGKSLELINPLMSNNYGQNWGASLVNGGTPGTANSIAATDIAPMILDVTQFPIIPRSTDPVTVTARMVDELPKGDTANLHYRVNSTQVIAGLGGIERTIVSNKSVGGIASVSPLATVTCNGHGFSTGDSIYIAGASPAEYNGVFTVTVVDPNTFTYPISGSPVSPAGGTSITATPVRVTCTNTTATATLANHGFVVGQTVSISGASPGGYNGAVTITNVTQNTFDYTVASTLSTPAIGTVIVRSYGICRIAGLTTDNALVTMPNHGFTNGTTLVLTSDNPTGYEGTFTISGVTTNTFTFTVSTSAPATASSWFSVYTAATASFTQVAMLDDGLHGDGAAGDGVFGATLPAQANNAIVEYYVRAADSGGHARTWPAPAGFTGSQSANLLYQVDNTYDRTVAWTPGSQPVYRLIMEAADRDELLTIGSRDPDRWSDVAMNGTFITVDGSGEDLTYQAGFRNRGHGTRLAYGGTHANNYKIEIPTDHTWKGYSSPLINYMNSPAQILGSTILQAAGMGMPNQQPIQVRVDGVNLAVGTPGPSGTDSRMYGTYASKEHYDSDFTARAFPDDPDGNLYIVHYTDYPYSTNTDNGNLRYEGTNPDSYRDTYFKQTNSKQDDWSDLIHMTQVLNDATISDANFVGEASKGVDIDQWFRYIALDTLLGNREGGLYMGQGDDYGLYRGIKDPRFKLVQWDMDTISSWGGSTTASIFTGYTSIPGFSRLLSNPDTVGRYYVQLLDLINTVFAPQNFNPLIDQLFGSWMPLSQINAVKSFTTARIANVLTQIPQPALTVASPLSAQGGYPYTTSTSTALIGTANPAETRSVTVNGQPATWDSKTGNWTAGTSTGGTGTSDLLVNTGADWKYFAARGFDVTGYQATIPVTSVAAAESVISNPANRSGSWIWKTQATRVPVINFLNNGTEGHFTSTNCTYQFPGQSGAVSNYVIEATYRLFVPAAGQYTFGVNSDDGFSLSLSNGTDTFNMSFDGTRTVGDTLQTFTFTTPGTYNLRLVYFQNTTGGEVELFEAAGQKSTFDSTFKLVGDVTGGGLSDSDQGTAWYASGFSDSGWNHGPSQLGYGDGDEATVTTYSDASPNTSGTQKNITTYFRRTFEVADTSQYTGLILHLLRDDGAIVYLNGTEVKRDNMPTGTITSTTIASSNTDDTTPFYNYSIDLGLLQVGTNVLAVEVHQTGATSSDISMDARLEATKAGGTGSGLPLVAGLNRFVVQTFDGPSGTGNKLKESSIDVWCDSPADPLAMPTDPLPALSDPPGLAANPHLNLQVRDSYLSGVPITVRVEIADEQDRVDRDVWNATATLSVDNPEMITLSATQVTLYNGMGSVLVTVTGTGSFNLTASWGAVTASRSITSLEGQSETIVSGTLSGSTTWSGIVHVTGNVTVPTGATLTIQPGTLVLMDGVTSGTGGVSIDVQGDLQSMGSATAPVTFTTPRYDAALAWGQIRHTNAAASLYQYTEILRAGRTLGEGHTGTGPAVRPSNSIVTFDHSSISDNVGKIMYSVSGSDLTFLHSLLARAVMGPEIAGTSLLFQNSFIEDMHNRDDGDGIYLHDQQAGQTITLRGGVVAVVDDDDIDTLGSTVLIDDMIVRNSNDKGVSGLEGVVNITRSLIVDNARTNEDGSTAALSIKTNEGKTAAMNVDRTTVYNDLATGIGIEGRNKYKINSGHTLFNVTNSVIWAHQAIQVDTPAYDPNEAHVSYSDLSTPWTYGGSHDNITADPQWVNLAGYDFRLQSTSPCIDAGDPAGAPDADITTADLGCRSLSSAGSYALRTITAGHITRNTVLYPAANPYHVIGDVIVDPGVTVTVLPGTQVFFDAGTGLTINGRLVADGTPSEQIRFTRTPGGSNWDGLTFLNTMEANSVSYALVEYGEGVYAAGGDNALIGLTNSSLVLDHDIFDHAQYRRIRTQSSSLIVRNSTFTDIFAAGETPISNNHSEQIWGNNAPRGGHLIIENNIFGSTKGHNDIMDIDGGLVANGDVMPRILNNVILGASDDAMDIEGDFYIEGNFISHVHKDSYNTDPGQSNGISAGDSHQAGHHYTVVRNVFFDVDHAVLAKDKTDLTFLDNTVVGSVYAAIYFELIGDSAGAGRSAYLDGDIFNNTPIAFDLTVRETATTPLLTINRSIVPTAWLARGTGNTDEAPRLSDSASGNVVLLPGSPALGTGPYGLDMGAKVPGGALISGEPAALTRQTTATLNVGGPAVVGYQYRLNNGSWSAETPVATPIQLAGLANGTYTVYVVGKNTAGVWQSQSTPAASKTWTVNTSLARVRINEVLAINSTAAMHGTTYPDMIELISDGVAAVDLSGMGISDDPANPIKFVLPAGTVLGVDQYLVLYADSDTTTAGLHVGFKLSGGSGGVYLFDTVANGSTLLDSVEYGPQVADLSIGRVGHDGAWTLTLPTFGTANVAVRTGNPATLKINEWFANGQVHLTDDFVELYNPDLLPVPLAGLSLTDDSINQPGKNPIGPLSFVAGGGCVAFTADDNAVKGPDHLDFNLSAGEEWLGLFDADLKPIDKVLYFDQTTDVSQGRSPDGGVQPYQFLAAPTPGQTNAVATAFTSLLNGLRITELMYNPLGDGDLEFIEMQNVGATTLDLTGVRLSGAVDFAFPAMRLAPSQYVVVARNVEKFSELYGPGINLAGEYSGKLSDSGDNIVLQPPSPYDAAILRFTYADHWYSTTAAGGYALTVKSTAALASLWDDAGNWQPGAVAGGSPGRADAGTLASDVVINEVLPHTDEPEVDMIELYNRADVAVDIGGWYLSDTIDNSKKFRIPDGTTLPAHGYEVFYQGHWVNHVMEVAANEFGNTGTTGFALSSYLGDQVWLSAADASGNITRVADDVTFGPSRNGESFGRWLDGAGNLAPMRTLTLPGVNNVQGNAPRVGPLVISEVMYNPVAARASDDDLEFVEIYNPTGMTVDLTHWRLRKGVDFDFAAASTLGPHQAVVVVPFDPADSVLLTAFRSAYLIDSSVTLVGPYSGHLSDVGQKVQLQRPDDPPLEDPTLYPGLLEDEVRYASAWGGAGTGSSLNRSELTGWGDSLASWTTAAPTPGTVVSISHPDTWKDQTNGNWTDVSLWNGSLSSYPDYRADVTVDTAHTVDLSSDQTANSLTVSNGGRVAIASTGGLTITTDVNVSAGGRLEVSHDGSVVSHGMLTVGDGGTVALSGSTINVGALTTQGNGNLTGGTLIAGYFDLQSGTVSTHLSGAGGLGKTTGGTVALSGNNTYTGKTTVSGGVLEVLAPHALPDGGSLAIGANGTVVLASDLGQAIELSGLVFDSLGGTPQTELAASADIVAMAAGVLMADSVPVAVSQAQEPETVMAESHQSSAEAQLQLVGLASLGPPCIDSQPLGAATAPPIIGPALRQTDSLVHGTETPAALLRITMAHDAVLAVAADRPPAIAAQRSLRLSSIMDRLWTLAETPSQKRILSPRTADQTLTIYWDR